jgi:hypothetical protein
MGQRVLQPIVNQQVQHVLGALDQQVQEALGSSGGAAPPTGTSGAEEGISPISDEPYDEKR